MRISDWSSDVCSSDLYIKGSASPPDTRPAGRYRGRSPAGRALQWHCRGQGFDPPRLHQFFKDLADTQLGLLFVGTATLCGGLDMIADVVGRSVEGRVGKEFVSTCRSQWSPYH